PAGPGGREGVPQLQPRGKRVTLRPRGIPRRGGGTGPQGHGRAASPPAARAGGAEAEADPRPGRAGPCAGPGAEGPGRCRRRDRRGRRSPHLGREEQEGRREPRQRRRRRHVGRSPPQASSDVSQQRPAAPRRACAVCAPRLRAGARSKGAATAPAQNGAARQDGGQREEEEGEYLGPVQVHRQDDPGEVPGGPRSGILKGFDPLLNLVLDGTIEYVRDPDDQYKLTEDTRPLGLVVCRGTSVVLICPQDGMEAIPNPFVQQQEA
uniref:LSM7 homolog, U6 small nuclear RNA and mRNA degradation associated n=1 Tax=Equus caballus TaxID=9796 RepID=F7D0N3_HORSE